MLSVDPSTISALPGQILQFHLRVRKSRRIDGAELAPLKWSSLKYGFEQGGSSQWQGRDTPQKRL